MTFAPACPDSVQLGVAMSHAMGTSQTLPIHGVSLYGPEPQAVLSKTRSQFAPGHQAPLCPREHTRFRSMGLALEIYVTPECSEWIEQVCTILTTYWYSKSCKVSDLQSAMIHIISSSCVGADYSLMGQSQAPNRPQIKSSIIII